MGLCLLAKFLMGLCLLAYCIISLLKNESSHTAVLFNGALSARTFLMSLCPLEMFNGLCLLRLFHGTLSTETVLWGFVC